MQAVLAKSDFDIREIKQKSMTVYVVLPPEYLEEHKRFMRLFVNLAIRGISQGKKAKHPILFVLDEFYSLGRLALMEKASGLLAGYGLKLWPVVQNLGQLKHLYPNNWETFFANAGAVQCFGVNDNATSEYLMSRMGKMARVETLGQARVRIVEALLEMPEIEQVTSRESGKQIVFRSGDLPMMLRRVRYDEAFPTNWFNPDPDFGHEGEPLRVTRNVPLDVKKTSHLPPASQGLPPPDDEVEDDWETKEPNTDTLPKDTQLAMTPPAKPLEASFAPLTPKDAFTELDELIGLGEVKEKVAMPYCRRNVA